MAANLPSNHVAVEAGAAAAIRSASADQYSKPQSDMEAAAEPEEDVPTHPKSNSPGTVPEDSLEFVLQARFSYEDPLISRPAHCVQASVQMGPWRRWARMRPQIEARTNSYLASEASTTAVSCSNRSLTTAAESSFPPISGMSASGSEISRPQDLNEATYVLSQDANSSTGTAME
jgi:hypothetical protein